MICWVTGAKRPSALDMDSEAKEKRKDEREMPKFQFNREKSGRTKKFKSLFVILGLMAALWFALPYLPGKKFYQAALPSSRVNQSTGEAGANKAINTKVELPTGRPVVLNPLKQFRICVMQWSGQLSGFLGNGGPVTLSDSKIGKRGAQVKFLNENDTEKMKGELYSAIKEWAEKGGKGNPIAGVQGIIVMGDGAPAYVNSWNVEFRKVCKANKLPEEQCELKVAGAIGSSFGEDKVYGPVEWKNNPRRRRCRGVLSTPA